MCNTPKEHDTGTAIGSMNIENDKTIVTEWSFAKRGDNTGWHEHKHDYVVVPMFTGKLEIFDGENTSIAELTEGQPYFRNKGVRHDVINGNDFACKFIEIEFL